jgi:ferredoxin
MKIKKIWVVSFSPTGTSKRVVNAIVSGMPGIPTENIDLTSPATLETRKFDSDDLVVIGVPVYAGRVAALAVQRLGGFAGNSTPAVITVTFGNREYEDALIELQDIAEKASFRTIAAGAFIGEHSFSDPAMPIAENRPDTDDLLLAEIFGKKISDKLNSIKDLQVAVCPEIPGNRPYKEGMGQLPFTPHLLESACTLCGTCLSVCPTGSISMESAIEMNSSSCIFCCACIKNCPENALIIDAAPLKEKRQWLHDNYSMRKVPELYIE